MAPTRWGIAGCGKVASDFANALQHQGSDSHVIVAVADHFSDARETFARKFAVEKIHESYDALAADPDIDVVYVAVINPLHFSTAKVFLMARKPVLCEKPLCLNPTETRQLVDLAERQETFLMEAMWSRFMPVYRELQRRLHCGEVGQLTHVYLSYGKPVAAIPRISRKDLGGGCVYDIGSYAIQLLLLAMGEEKPLEIKAVGQLSDEGVETDVSCSMRFSGNRFGTFVLSTRCQLPMQAYVTGTRGTMTLGAPCIGPTSLSGPSGEFSAPLDPSDRQYFSFNRQGLKYEAEEVATCLREGLLESSIMPHSSSLMIAEIMLSVRQQLGVAL